MYDPVCYINCNTRRSGWYYCKHDLVCHRANIADHTCVQPITATAVAAVWARGGSFSLRDNSHMPEMRARVTVPCRKKTKTHSIHYGGTVSQRIIFIYLLQLGCHPVAVVILHVYKT